MNIAQLTAAAAALAILPVAAFAQGGGPEAAQAPDATPQAAPAAPAGPVEVSEGASVAGNDGALIGTIVQVTPEAVVVDTGANQIPLPREAFGQGDTGLTLNITKAELDASYSEQMAAAMAELDTRLVAGSAVMTADAQPLGTVDTVEGENVVLTLTGAEKLTLGKEVFALDANGGLMVRATKADIDQARAGAAAAAPTAG